MNTILLYMTVCISLQAAKLGYGNAVDADKNSADRVVASGRILTGGQAVSKQRDIATAYYHAYANSTASLNIRNFASQVKSPDEFYPAFGDIASGIDNVKEYHSNCIQSNTTLTCRTIPTRIPPGVTALVVTYQDTKIPDRSFDDPSFASVLHLSLNGIGLSEFSDSSFDGLQSVTNLSITGMDELYGASLQLAISNTGVLPKLKYFALNPGETFRSPFIKFESTFLKKLAQYHMDCFNLSNIISEIKFNDFFQFASISNLAIMNLTGSFLVIDYSIKNEDIDISQPHISKPILKVLDSSRLRTTNVTDSNAKIGVYKFVDGPRCFGTHPTYHQFLLIETWYANNIYPGQTDFQGYCDLSTYQMFLKRLEFTGNIIRMLNVTFILPKNNTLLYVDLSNNNIEYVGPGLLSNLFALEELVLSGNKLYHMEHSPDFESLLMRLERLTFLDLANNNLSVIPSKMFMTNRHLNILILANNHLTSISFELRNLTELCLFDVRGNAIATLSSYVLSHLQLVFKKRHEQLAILFEGNPIECSCESLTFIKWLVFLQYATNESIHCSYGNGYIDVDKDAVDKCNFLCNRPMVIAVSTTCSICIVALLISILILIKRFKNRKKKRDVEEQLRESIEAGNYMCFMAISGNDEALVERVILAHLRRLLQGKFGLDRDLVCTGTRFKPGFAICEEAYRLMRKCQVFIAVVSDSFMRSQYCKIELQEACKQNKPTILIFLGHVETEDMPPYMQEVFRRTSRAWIKQNDEGYYYVVPSLIDMSEAIWDLALADLL